MSERTEFIRRVTVATHIEESKARPLAGKLASYASESKHLAEQSCNRELTQAEQARDDELDQIVASIGKQLGLHAYRQGDPRGHTIRVVVGRELATNWDGETVGIG